MSIEKEYTNVETSWNEAHLINSALDDSDITVEQANKIIYEKLLPNILHTKLFIELPLERLEEMGNISQGQALLNILNEKDDNDMSVLDSLAENSVSLAIAMQEGFDKDEHMIEALKKLNEKGIKPTLWSVLTDDIGYWTNKANVIESVDKLVKMIKWARENGIEIDKIGLDYEPPIQILKALNRKDINGIINVKREYDQKAAQNEKELGDIQMYMDYPLSRIMEKYDIGIETYVPAKPLRRISKKLGLILEENENTDRVPMTYTSAFKILSSIILNGLDDSDIPALGIVGSDEEHTPGRDLKESKDGEKKPESHLNLDELTYAFNKTLVREKPFRTHNVFALDSAKTLEMVLKAREDATNE